MKKKIDIAALCFSVLYLVAFLSPSFTSVRVNRISPMEHLGAWASMGNLAFVPLVMSLIMIALVLFKGTSEKRNFLTGIWASICLGMILYFSGFAANILMEGHTSTYRVCFGFGTYIMMLGAYGAITRCNTFIKKEWKRILTSFLGIIIAALAFPLGIMEKTSIMTEYHAWHDQFIQGLGQHIGISIAVVLVSILIGLPIGYLCYKNRVLDTILMGILNVVRSVPAIALIYVMVFPLSSLGDIPFFDKLGVSGFGFAPVFCALLLYGLFQIINSMSGALKTISPEYIKTARGMGMNDGTIMRRIQIPMVLPVIVSGIRVAMISTFTGVSLGTMVGYPALGRIITLGGGSAVALDLVFLGAVPIMIMIFITDMFMRKVAELLQHKLGLDRGTATEELSYD